VHLKRKEKLGVKLEQALLKHLQLFLVPGVGEHNRALVVLQGSRSYVLQQRLLFL